MAREQVSRRGLRLPRHRRFVCDLLRQSSRVPSQSHTRSCNIAGVRELRQHCRERISWPAIFMKAYALMAKDTPELRQVLMTWPWMRLYQHPESVCRMTVHREHEGEDWTFFADFPTPEHASLIELQERIDDHKRSPIESLPKFRKQSRFVSLPSFVRRAVWWMAFNLFPRKRASYVGTFGMTTISGTGATIAHPPCMYTSVLTFGPVSEEGSVEVTIAYDHRVLDGYRIGCCLQALEDVLNGPILDELESLMEEESVVNTPRMADAI